MDFFLIVILLLVSVVLYFQSVHFVKDYECLHVFRMGKLIAIKQPGLVFLLPFLYQTCYTDLRLRTASMYKQKLMSKDNVSFELSANFFYRVSNPASCWGNPVGLINNAIQGILFSSAGEFEFQELISESAKFKERLLNLVRAKFAGSGVEIEDVSILSLHLSPELETVLAKLAIAERESRAKITLSEGDYQASPLLAQAAGLLSEVPEAMRLRELETVSIIAKEQNARLFFPFLVNLTDPHHEKQEKREKEDEEEKETN